MPSATVSLESSAPSIAGTVSPFSVTGADSRGATRIGAAMHRAENCVSAMQRINEQIASLAEQRRKLQDELRGIQCQVNEEFDRILKPSKALPAKVVSREVEPGKDGAAKDQAETLRMEVAETRLSAMARVAS